MVNTLNKKYLFYKPKLSVMIPAYNEEKFLGQCLDSVTEASAEDFEIIVFNDGSQDGTAKIAEDRAQKDPRIKLFTHHHGKNLGEWITRNRLLNLANGMYLCFLDADDIIEANRFDVALNILQSDAQIDGVLDAVGVFFDDESSEEKWGNRNFLFSHDTSISPDDFLEATLDGRCRMLTPGLVVRKSLFEKCGFYHLKRRLSEDFHLWLRMAAVGRFKVGEAQKPVVWYRRHAGNTWVPHRYDSFRDLDVVGDVLQWAKRSPWVPPDKRLVLAKAFENKLYHCLQMAQDEKLRGRGLAAALTAFRYAPHLLTKRRFWANVGRLVLPRA